ncbi:S8 family serine peptidase [Candidatus Woesearchaeota archaeon]|nr:S8 family serine peptidase [Candidatus Woesearchaeota archaeon]
MKKIIYSGKNNKYEKLWLRFRLIFLILSALFIIAPYSYALDKSRVEIGASTLNDLGITGKGNTICLIDDGVDYTHENLGDCTTIDFQNGNCKVIDGIDIVQGNSDILPDPDQYHGTHIAGILISDHTNLKGIAPDARLAVVRVISDNDNVGSCQQFASAIEWCANNSNQYNITSISFSLGRNDCEASFNSTFNQAIDNAHDKGILFVKSSGNSLSDFNMTFPAELPNVTAVGSTTKEKVSAYTRRNPTDKLDLLAPGHKIRSTKTGGGFTSFFNEIVCFTDDQPWLFALGLCNSGTSYAAPHIAASVALLKEYDPALTPFAIEKLLKDTGDPIVDSVTGLTFKKINLLNALGVLDWPTFHHDNRRTGFTLLKGDIADESDVDKTNLVLQGDVTQDHFARVSVADLDNNGNMEIVVSTSKVGAGGDGYVFATERNEILWWVDVDEKLIGGDYL